MPRKTTNPTHWLASLVTLGGNLPFCLVDGEHVIGRGRDCNIIVRDVSVSRKHAIVTVSDGVFTIRDCHSSNGVYLEDIRVESAKFDRDSKLAVGNVRLFAVPGESRVEVQSWLEKSETYRQLQTAQIDVEDLAGDLTPTQGQILRMILAGKTEVEIARLSFRSQATVHNHIQAIYKRLDVHSLPDLLFRVYGNSTQIINSRKSPP